MPHHVSHMLTTMTPPALVLSSPSHLAKPAPLSLLSTLDKILGQGDAAKALATTWSPRPGAPERALARPWTRQDTSCPCRRRPPLDPSFHPPAHHDPSNPVDNLIGSPAPCRRRHGRRPPPRVLQYTMSLARLRQPLSSP
jgi:hypothetical protein